MKPLYGSWCNLDTVIYSKSLENKIAIVAPFSKDCNVEYDDNYFEKIIKGEIEMEVVNIENNIATLTNGVAIRKIDLTKDYVSEVNKIIEELEEKLKYYKDVKQNIYDDQRLILNYILKGDKDEHNN